MEFTGIDSITYGVEDMAACRRFLADWGLAEAGADGSARVFRTLDGTEVRIAPHDDPALPPAIESGSTLRRVVWGVAGEAELREVRDRIANEASFAEEPDGPSCDDPNGARLSFRSSRRGPVALSGSPFNTLGNIARIDRRSPVYDHAEPVGIGHVVFFTADVAATLAFYTERLGFRVSDSYPGAGYFLRCRTEGGHHDLFLLQGPEGKRGLNHVAYSVRDIEEVFGGGLHMSAQGWATQIGPGRHPISSAYFWYLHCPCGGLAEYYTNEDWCTAAWQPAEWPRTGATFAEWAIAGGIDAKTRRQKRD